MIKGVPCGARTLDLSRPRIMGVLNVTPDSFTDGGQLYRDGRVDTDALLARADQMLAEGADIMDVGGESTRPSRYSCPPSEKESGVTLRTPMMRGRLRSSMRAPQGTALAILENCYSAASRSDRISARSRRRQSGFRPTRPLLHQEACLCRHQTSQTADGASCLP